MRRLFPSRFTGLFTGLTFGLLAGLLLLALPAGAQDKTGVLLLHGKSPGSPASPGIASLEDRLRHAGLIVLTPDMPWSARRYMDGDWAGAMAEIARHIQTLRGRGATRVVIAGHSMGCAAAVGYAARHGDDVDALVLLAPGHTPVNFYANPRSPVRQSIDDARAMVAAGQGDTRRDFSDSNQGRALTVRLTAKQYLSWWDPDSDAEMSRMAPLLSPRIPVLVVVGNEDPIFSHIRPYLYDRLPAQPQNRLLQIEASHVRTPAVAAGAVADWIHTLAWQ
jgi:pimeloyl-ACP methyl ester carboxylesterase